MNLSGIRYGADIATAAASHGLDPALLAAVAAQETGGPGSNSGNNVVGDGGHGHGLFQIDDRSWAFAKTPAAMNPAKNADVAASILQANLQRYGGNVSQALSAYNSGAPNATGTKTTWSDGSTLGYADSVMRHYAGIVAAEQGQAVADGRETSSSVNALATLGASQAATASPSARTAPATASTIVPAATSSTLPVSAASAPASQQALLQLPQAPSPAPAIPAGSQAQAATNVGAQADNDEANLVDQGDVFSPTDDED